jgi:hypothetical protein
MPGSYLVFATFPLGFPLCADIMILSDKYRSTRIGGIANENRLSGPANEAEAPALKGEVYISPSDAGAVGTAQ